MKILAVLAVVTLGLSACTSAERGATTGGLLGAGAGALLTGNLRGAAVGGALGAVTGAIIGKTRDGRCIYRDRRGREYIDDC